MSTRTVRALRALVATSALVSAAAAMVACENGNGATSARGQPAGISPSGGTRPLVPPFTAPAFQPARRPGAAPALPAVTVADAGAPGPSKYQAFAAAFDFERSTLGAPGATVAIIEHGQVTFTYGSGTAGPNSTQPVNADTIFRVGTTTAALTSAAQLALIDHGKATLDESITKLVPKVALTGPNAAALTTRALLSDRSGLEDFTQLSAAPTNTCATGAATLQSFVAAKAFADDAIFMNAPGLFYTSSNPNFILAGAAIENESGRYFSVAMKTELFAPLGMTRTFFLPSEAVSAGNFSDGLSTNPDGTEWDVTPAAYDCAAYRPYGYAFSTATDYAKFVQLELNGDPQVLSDASRLAMQSAQVNTVDFGKISSEGYGLTVQTGYVSRANAYYPTKTVSTVGSIPGFTSEAYFFPETGFGIVILANADGALFVTSRDLAVQSFGGLPAAAPIPASTNAVRGKFARYAGTYLDTTGELGRIVVSDVEGALRVDMPDAATFGYTFWPTLSPMFNDSFIMAVEGSPWRVSFVADSTGKYEYLVILDLIVAERVVGDGGTQ